jgi:hypothetical protein
MAQMAVTVDKNIKNDVEKQKTARKHIPLKERLKNHSGNYKTEEWDTGEPVGRELL